jgi:hypothetical protein
LCHASTIPRGTKKAGKPSNIDPPIIAIPPTTQIMKKGYKNKIFVVA